MKNILAFLLFFCTLNAYAQTHSPVDRESEVTHKNRVILPYIIIDIHVILSREYKID